MVSNGTGADRYGRMGEIMPQDEFYAMMKIADALTWSS